MIDRDLERAWNEYCAEGNPDTVDPTDIFEAGYGAALERHQWRPIETAPQDVLILVWQDGGPRLRYVRQGELWDENEFLDDSEIEATHWLHLPPAPEADDDDGV